MYGHSTQYSYDATGMWIYVYDENDNRYKYDNGALFDEDGNKYGGGNFFLDGILKGLNIIYATGAVGSWLIDFFGNGSNNVSIYSGNLSGAFLSGKKIMMNRDLLGSMIWTTQGRQMSELWLDLAHELAHIRQLNEDRQKALEIWFVDWGERQIIYKTEQYACRIENLFRVQTGLPLRTHYASLVDSRNNAYPHLLSGLLSSNSVYNPIFSIDKSSGYSYAFLYSFFLLNNR